MCLQTSSPYCPAPDADVGDISSTKNGVLRSSNLTTVERAPAANLQGTTAAALSSQPSKPEAEKRSSLASSLGSAPDLNLFSSQQFIRIPPGAQEGPSSRVVDHNYYPSTKCSNDYVGGGGGGVGGRSTTHTNSSHLSKSLSISGGASFLPKRKPVIDPALWEDMEGFSSPEKNLRSLSSSTTGNSIVVNNTTVTTTSSTMLPGGGGGDFGAGGFHLRRPISPSAPGPTVATANMDPSSSGSGMRLGTRTGLGQQFGGGRGYPTTAQSCSYVATGQKKPHDDDANKCRRKTDGENSDDEIENCFLKSLSSFPPPLSRSRGNAGGPLITAATGGGPASGGGENPSVRATTAVVGTTTTNHSINRQSQHPASLPIQNVSHGFESSAKSDSHERASHHDMIVPGAAAASIGSEEHELEREPPMNGIGIESFGDDDQIHDGDDEDDAALESPREPILSSSLRSGPKLSGHLILGIIL